MTGGSTDDQAPVSHGCVTDGCRRVAEFWVYHRGVDRWRPRCEHHTVQLHPSLEVSAWLESGYARPAELGRPDAPPPSPPEGRPAAFRTIVDRAMGWD